MPKIHPHILFKGNTEEAFGFYKSVFGGNFSKVLRMKDLPANPLYPVAETQANKIVFISLPIGKSDMLIGSDVGEQFMDQTLITGNRYTIYLDADSKEQAMHLFDALSMDGEVEMPLTESTKDAYFGMLADKFGIQWMISFEPIPTPENA